MIEINLTVYDPPAVYEQFEAFVKKQLALLQTAADNTGFVLKGAYNLNWRWGASPGVTFYLQFTPKVGARMEALYGRLFVWLAQTGKSVRINRIQGGL